jgi:hypothetical protein
MEEILVAFFNCWVIKRMVLVIVLPGYWANVKSCLKFLLKLFAGRIAVTMIRLRYAFKNMAEGPESMILKLEMIRNYSLMVSAALKQAIGRTGAKEGLLIHSDRGVQYASKDYQQLLDKHGFICSRAEKETAMIMHPWNHSGAS